MPSIPTRVPIRTAFLLLATLLLGCPPKPTSSTQPATPATTPTLITSTFIDPPPVTDTEIRTALQRGVDYLLVHQSDWAPTHDDKLLPTTDPARLALVLLAFYDNTYHFNSSPANFNTAFLTYSLRDLTAATTTARALTTCYLAATQRLDRPFSEVPPASARFPDDLVRNGLPDAGHPTTYPTLKDATWNIPASAHVLLALNAAAGSHEIPDRYWTSNHAFLLRTRLPDGSWPLTPNAPSSPAATAAALSSLLTVRSNLDRAKALPALPVDLFNHFDQEFDPASQDYFYLDFATRLIRQRGIATLHGHDWSAEVAHHLVRSQRPDGSWPPDHMTAWDRSDPLASTACALRALASATKPVLISTIRLDADPPATRELILSNLTFKVSRLRCLCGDDLSWQTLTFDSPFHLWRRAPFLFLPLSHDPRFTPDQLNRLRAYVAQGGFILTSAETPDPALTPAIARYATALIDPPHPFRPLPVEYIRHAGLDDFTNVQRFPIYALTDDHRELWIHANFSVLNTTRPFAAHLIFHYTCTKSPFGTRVTPWSSWPPRLTTTPATTGSAEKP